MEVKNLSNWKYLDCHDQWTIGARLRRSWHENRPHTHRRPHLHGGSKKNGKTIKWKASISCRLLLTLHVLYLPPLARNPCLKQRLLVLQGHWSHPLHLHSRVRKVWSKTHNQSLSKCLDAQIKSEVKPRTKANQVFRSINAVCCGPTNSLTWVIHSHVEVKRSCSISISHGLCSSRWWVVLLHPPKGSSSSAIGGMFRSRAMVAWSCCEDSGMLVVQESFCTLCVLPSLKLAPAPFGGPVQRWNGCGPVLLYFWLQRVMEVVA